MPGRAGGRRPGAGRRGPARPSGARSRFAGTTRRSTGAASEPHRADQPTTAPRRPRVRPQPSFEHPLVSRLRELRHSGKKLRQRPFGARLTTRTAILALVVCALVLSISYPLRQYLAQRSQIVKLEQENQKAQQLVDTYQEQTRKLNDPSYIKQQARERLQYVIPGEIPLVVVDKRHPSPTPTPTPTASPTPPSSWYGNLWESVEKAGAGQ